MFYLIICQQNSKLINWCNYVVIPDVFNHVQSIVNMSNILIPMISTDLIKKNRILKCQKKKNNPQILSSKRISLGGLFSSFIKIKVKVSFSIWDRCNYKFIDHPAPLRTNDLRINLPILIISAVIKYFNFIWLICTSRDLNHLEFIGFFFFFFRFYSRTINSWAWKESKFFCKTYLWIPNILLCSYFAYL